MIAAAAGDRGEEGTVAGPGPAAAAGTSAGTSQTAGEVTAQQLFRQMMRDLIGPALRELGFRGSVGCGFRYASGDYVGFVSLETHEISPRMTSLAGACHLCHFDRMF